MRVLAGTVLAVLTPLAHARQTPQTHPPGTMTKIVVRLMGPRIKPGSFSALPRTMYCAGPHYARVEDPPDARQHMHKLIIIAEPDAYSVNYAFVVADVVATVSPSCFSLTCQTLPTRFSSTSNSTSRRPSRCLAFSLALERPLHLPLTRTSRRARDLRERSPPLSSPRRAPSSSPE